MKFGPTSMYTLEQNKEFSLFQNNYSSVITRVIRVKPNNARQIDLRAIFKSDPKIPLLLTVTMYLYTNNSKTYTRTIFTAISFIFLKNELAFFILAKLRFAV